VQTQRPTPRTDLDPPAGRRPVGLAFGLLLALAVACGPSDPLEGVRAQQAQGDFAASLEPLRELLAERPDDAEIQYLYGRALALTGQTSLAEWSLREAMNDPEFLVPAGLQLAFGALQTGNFPMAIETTTRMLEAEPENVDVLLMRANAYAHSRMHHEEALEDVARLEELAPDNLDAMEPKILALLGLERAEEAGEALADLGRRIEETGDETPLAGWYCATAALFADESGEKERAAELWADCTERFPAHTNVINNALQFYDARFEFDRSLEILRRAYEEMPSSREIRVSFADRLRAAGQTEEAEALLREGTESEALEVQAAAWIDLAKHFQTVEDFPAAARAAERSVETARKVGPVHAQLLFEYADALLLAGELDRALEVTEGMTVPAHREMIRARVAQERGQPAEALEHFDEAFRLWPDNVFARYYAALAAEAVGDFDRAIEAYRYAIRLAADATDARVRLARLHEAEGRPAEALAVLRTNVQKAPLDVAGEMYTIELWALTGRDDQVRRAFSILRNTSPDHLGMAVAQAAKGLRERAGAGATVRMLRGTLKTGLDLSEPRAAEALRALVEHSHPAGLLDEAGADVRAAVAAHPDEAAFQEILGRWHELEGADREAARVAYARALELDPTYGRAELGLGRLALPEDPEAALARFDRVLATEPESADALRGAAAALSALGRAADSEARLEALLRHHPLEAETAKELVERHLAAGAVTERSVDLAQRIVRFGDRATGLDLLSRVYEGQGRADLAAQTAEEARALRVPQGG
jgi:tetratricopeptide (TPR) repeat protein